MEYYKTKGIILKEVYVGEADKILKVFTKLKGKISVSAKGSRKNKSHLAAGTQLFSYSDLLIYSGTNYNIIQQLEVIKIFHGIREDIEKLTYASYFLELLDGATQEEEVNEELLLLTLKTLSVLEKTERSPRLISVIFQLRLMSLIGYMPEINVCVNCKSQKEINHFNSRMGGVICDECNRKAQYSYKMSQPTWYTLQYILCSELSQLFKFDIEEYILNELEKISKSYVSYHIDKQFKTLNFLKEIQDIYD